MEHLFSLCTFITANHMWIFLHHLYSYHISKDKKLLFSLNDRKHSSIFICKKGIPPLTETGHLAAYFPGFCESCHMDWILFAHSDPLLLSCNISPRFVVDHLDYMASSDTITWTLE